MSLRLNVDIKNGKKESGQGLKIDKDCIRKLISHSTTVYDKKKNRSAHEGKELAITSVIRSHDNIINEKLFRK